MTTRRAAEGPRASHRAIHVLAMSIVFVAGCSSPAPPVDVRSPSPVAHPEAVSADFFTGTTPSAACSGTLLAPNLVLTAAHCAAGATSARVVAPDAKGQTSSVKQLRVLDWNLRGTAEENRSGHDIAVLFLAEPITIDSYANIDKGYCGGCTVVHVSRPSDRAATAIESAPLRLSRRASKAHPFALTIIDDTRTAGGALVRKDATGRSIVEGIMSGWGAETGLRYVALTSSNVAEEWLREALTAARVELAPGAAPSASAVQPRSLHVLDDGDVASGVDPGGVALVGSEGGQKLVESGAPTTKADTPEGTAEPLVLATTLDDGQTDPGTGAPAPGAPDGPPLDTELVAVPEEDMRPAVFEGSGTYFYTSLAPNDPVGNDTAEYARSVDGVANVIGAHGSPGLMDDPPDQETLDAMAAAKKPIVLASCFGAADDREANEGFGSNAKQVAEAAGVDPATVYGCTGYVFNGNLCNGRWLDGNGHIANAPANLDLQNCPFEMSCEESQKEGEPCSMVGDMVGACTPG